MKMFNKKNTKSMKNIGIITITKNNYSNMLNAEKLNQKNFKGFMLEKATSGMSKRVMLHAHDKMPVIADKGRKYYLCDSAMANMTSGKRTSYREQSNKQSIPSGVPTSGLFLMKKHEHEKISYDDLIIHFKNISAYNMAGYKAIYEHAGATDPGVISTCYSDSILFGLNFLLQNSAFALLNAMMLQPSYPIQIAIDLDNIPQQQYIPVALANKKLGLENQHNEAELSIITTIPESAIIAHRVGMVTNHITPWILNPNYINLELTDMKFAKEYHELVPKLQTIVYQMGQIMQSPTDFTEVEIQRVIENHIETSSQLNYQYYQNLNEGKLHIEEGIPNANEMKLSEIKEQLYNRITQQTAFTPDTNNFK